MRRSRWRAPVCGALLVVAGAGATGQQGGDEPLTVHAVRFFRPASGTTTIEGVCELRLSALASTGSQEVRYRFEVAVFDSAGLQLQQAGWTRAVPPTVAAAAGAATMESFGFSAAPGLYRVHLRAVPESGGTAIEKDLQVRAFAGSPGISDLALGIGASRAVSDTEALAPGEFRRAGLAMRTAPVPRLSPTDATLTYYAEVYPWAGAATAGELRVDVLGDSGRTIVSTPPRPVQVGPQGGITRGSVDLAGLPEGAYRLRLQVRLGDSSVVTEAPFRMGSLTVASAVPAAAPADDPFAGLSEAQLDSLYAPTELIQDARTEAGVYRNLSVEGKRRYLREFWRRRDPTPGSPDNSALTQFYRQVAYTNSAFHQSRVGAMPGWRTDRGRIYLRHGRPDEMLQRPMASPRPYEVWKYTRDRGYWYVFIDRNGMGDFTLVATNDRREPGLPSGIQALSLDRDGIDEVTRFLGIAPDFSQPE